MKFSTILIGVVIAAAAADDRAQTPAPSPEVSPTVAAPAVSGSTTATPILPEALRHTQFKTVDGHLVRLSDFADKLVVVNIWATWCPPCVLEMPRLSSLSDSYKKRGVVVLGLANTYNEQNDISRVRQYLRKKKIHYRSLWDDGTLANALIDSGQGRKVVPQTFVISKDGHIVKHFSGFNLYTTADLLRAAVEQALKDQP